MQRGAWFEKQFATVGLKCAAAVVGAALTYGGGALALAQQQEHGESPTHQCEVVSIEGDKLTVKSPDGQQTHSHRVTDQTQITIEGRPAKLDDLRPDDKLLVTISPDDPQLAERIEVTREQNAPLSRILERSLQRKAERRESGLGILVIPRRTGNGIEVAEVFVGGVADRAGIRGGDWIVSINGQKIDSVVELVRAVRDVDLGERFELQIRRDGRERQVAAMLGEGEAVAGTDEPIRQRQFGYRSEEKAWLGVRIGRSDQQGVRIERVYPGSPAARAGISSDDVILKIEGQQVSSPDEAIEQLDRFQPGDEVSLTMLRDNREHERSVRLSDREEFFGDRFRREYRSEFFDDNGYDDERSMMYGYEENIPEAAMMLEFNRHLCQQIQRLERKMSQLTEEVRGMREQLDELRPRRQFRPQPQQRFEEPPRQRRFRNENLF